VIQSIAVLTPIYVTGFWLIVFLNSSIKKNKAKYFLGFFMMVAFVLYLGHSLFFLGQFEVYLFYDPVYLCSSLLVYPMYYQYVRLLTTDRQFNSTYLYHYIPAFIFGLVALILHRSADVGTSESIREYFKESYKVPSDYNNPLFTSQVVYLLHRLVFAGQVVTYFIGGIRLIRKYRAQILQFYSNNEFRNINWVYNIFISLVFTAILSFIFNVIGKFNLYDHDWGLLISSLLISSMLFLLGFLANEQNPVVQDLERKDREVLTAVIEEELPQGDFKKKIEKLFDEDKVYLNPDLNIWEVASLLGTNRTYLSGFINKTYNVNFSAFVNRYRVEEAKIVLAREEMDKYSLEVIGEKCGFGSYNNFIRVFREFEQMTPGRFRTQKKS